MWPQGGSAWTKKAGTPTQPRARVPAWAVFVPPNKDVKELPGASVDVCKWLLYSARSWSLPRDVFSRRPWKHRLSIANNTPPRPPLCPSHGGQVLPLSGFGLRCPSPGRRADLRAPQAWVILARPQGSRPGSVVEGGESRAGACSRPHGPEAPFASSAPGARPSQAGLRTAVSPSPGAPGKLPGPRVGDRRGTVRPPHPPKPDTRPLGAPRGPVIRNFLLPPVRLAVASRLAPRALPLRPPADWKRPRRRPGWERRQAAPQGPRALLGCKLSGRREGGRRGAWSRQAPAPARPRWQ